MLLYSNKRPYSLDDVAVLSTVDFDINNGSSIQKFTPNSESGSASKRTLPGCEV